MRDKIARSVGTIVLAAAALAPWSGVAGAQTAFEEGRPAPALTLPRLDGSGVGSLADYRGRKVVLHVFASW